jgi:beta-lactamase regulating signal transducer with metallopeptidase domain
MMIAWLLTWLWQGLALVALISMGVGLGRRIDAKARYAIWWAGLGALLWLGWASVSSLGVRPAIIVVASPASNEVPMSLGVAAPFVVPDIPVALILALVGIWLLALALGLARLGAAGYRLVRLKADGEPLPGDREERLTLWRQVRGTGRQARLVVSDATLGVSVLGLIRPCIAIPRSLVAGLDDDDLDRVVLHEFAHVQRWDDWTRLAQTLVEIAIGFHPAVWWASRALNLEREVACDDWVVARSGAPRAYARCLSRVAEAQLRRSRLPLVPALAGARAGDLVRRVDRLLDTARDTHARRPRWAGAVVVVGPFGLALGLASLPPMVAQRPAVLEIVGLPTPDPHASTMNLRPGLAPLSVAPLQGSLQMNASRPVSVGARPSGVVTTRPLRVRHAFERDLEVGRHEAAGGDTPLADTPPADTPPMVPAALTSRPTVDAATVLFARGPSLQGPPAHEPDAGEGGWADIGRFGVAVGSGAQKAGMATAGAFSGVAKSFGLLFE